jgi:hypothetical protein
MNEQHQIPIYDAEEPTEESRRLTTIFSNLESRQLESLDETSRSIIGRVPILLVVLLAAISFGNIFTSVYLNGNLFPKTLIIATIIFYLLAMAISALVVRPRKYRVYQYNVSRMRVTLEAIIAYKMRYVLWANIFFMLGSIALAALIVSIIWIR